MNPNEWVRRYLAYIVTIILGIAAVVLFYVAFKPGVYSIREFVNGADIQFSADRAWVSSASECVRVSWSVQGISAIYVNEQGVVGTGETENCQPLDTPISLRVVLLDGGTREYKLDVRVNPFLSTQSLFMAVTAILLLVAAIGVFWANSAALSRTIRFQHQRIVSFLGHIYTSDIFAWLIVFFGAALRLNQYIFNRVIWGDEALLALNIMSHSYGQFFQPLDYEVASPIGFLPVERFVIDIFGVSEYAFRFIPMLVSVAALILLLVVARRILDRSVVPLTLLFFAASEPLIYYASELKQYSLDLLIALAACLLFFQMRAGEYRLRRIVLWAGTGAVLLWFSHPAVFVFASVALSLIYTHRHEIATHWRPLLFVFAIWGLSFALNYFVSLRGIGSNEYLTGFWQAGFAPHFVAEAPGWLLERFTTAFGWARILDLPQFALIAFAIGVAAIYKVDKSAFLLVMLPILFALAAAILRRYPFADRLLLFLLPFFMIGIAQGLHQIIDRTEVLPLWARVALYLLLLSPILSVNSQQPAYEPDVRPALEYIDANKQEDDALYLYGGTSATYMYYAALYQLDFEREFDGRYDFLQSDQYDFAEGERVWVFRRGSAVDDEQWQLTLVYFEQHGEKIDEHSSIGGSSFLYEMDEDV